MKLCWKYAACLLLILLLPSCKGNNSKVSQEDNVSMHDTMAQVVDIPDVETEDVVVTPARVDELFDDFIWNFTSNEKLQRRRIGFPLPIVTAEGTQLIDKDDWEYDLLISEEPTYTLVFDNEDELDKEGDTSLESAEVEWVYLDTKMRQRYFFNRNHGAWELDSISLMPLPSGDKDEGFVDFYRSFATDSIYQLEHITNPIGFVTLDPDDEFSILETTMGISQWFAFRPELPKDRLTNINYGQANDDLSRQKILKVNGFEDGSSIILYFRKRGNEWEMYKFEDTSI